MTTPHADDRADGRPEPGAELDAVRSEVAETIGELEDRLDLSHQWQELRSRVRSRFEDQPITVASVAVASAAVVSLAVILVVRAARR